MQLPNSGMPATMNATGHYKELGLEKYPDWYYQKKHIKEICGTDSFRHRQRRRPVSSWIRRGDLLCPEKDRRDQRSKSAPF